MMTIWNELYTFFWILFSAISLAVVWLLILSPFVIVYGIYKLWRWWREGLGD